MKLLIQTATGRVVNRIADPQNGWQPPAGHHIVPDDGRQIAAPPAARTMPPRAFMDVLTMERQGQITAVAMGSPAAFLWLLRLAAATEVDCDDAETIAGVLSLRDAGAILPAEADALLRR